MLTNDGPIGQPDVNVVMSCGKCLDCRIVYTKLRTRNGVMLPQSLVANSEVLSAVLR